MANIPAYIQKTLRMKPEVEKIFTDLETYLDYCRINLVKFDPADLYKSRDWRESQRSSGVPYERKPYLGKKPRFENRNNGERFSR
jgi:hypothetical protein